MTRQRTQNVINATAVLGCAFLFAAASCESKKPATTEPTETNEPAEALADDPDSRAATQAVFEAKEPVDVGPKAPAVFAIAGLQGYTEPCGCTLDVMLGGIDRITEYVEHARTFHPAVAFVDAGDLFFETATLEAHEVPQEKARVEVVREGLRRMKLEVTVPGEKDFALGHPFYAEQLEAAKIAAIGANLTIDGAELPATHRVDLDGVDTLFVGVVDPTHYAGIDGVTATDPAAALRNLAADAEAADATILLAHGDLPFAKEMLAALPGADFAVVGHPRETDQVDQVDGAYTLEPYDQGRYFGILKLIGAADADGASFANARQGSKSELEKVERQIEHVNRSIDRMPPATPGEEPEVLLTLRRRLQSLEQRREEIKNAAVEVPKEGPSFIWRSVAMEPGYPVDDEMTAVREAYNRQLRELNSAVEFEIPEAKPGEAVFVGSNVCAQCHAPATEFWKTTAHADALTTLEERHKDFDQKCIGCHVVGYEQPGGSVLGKLQYDATLTRGDDEVPVSKDLRHVGCESCHGPGSQHYLQPVGSDGQPAHIIRDPTVKECMQCHVPEHSPRFAFDLYVEEITGEGHERSPSGD